MTLLQVIQVTKILVVPISHWCTELEGTFSLSINDKHCSPFIVEIMKKTSFYSLPPNSVYRCEMGIRCIESQHFHV